jgi:hypothetical protein
LQHRKIIVQKSQEVGAKIHLYATIVATTTVRPVSSFSLGRYAISIEGLANNQRSISQSSLERDSESYSIGEERESEGEMLQNDYSTNLPVSIEVGFDSGAELNAWMHALQALIMQ